MNILIDLLPFEVEIEGKMYSINTDFRVAMMFESLMQDENILDSEKGYMALDLFYEVIPPNIPLAVEKIQWFYKCGKDNIKSEGFSNSNKTKNIYSFEHDDDYIYSAFLTQYGIDLQDVEGLHWWKFKAMFKGLKEDNKISKIMSYRSIVIDNDMSEEDKKYYREMKKVYALPDLRSEEEKELDFHNTLSNLI